MGAGASAGLAAATAAASEEELKAFFSGLSDEDRKRLTSALSEPKDADAVTAPSGDKEVAPQAGSKKVLIVATSAATMGDHATGAWSEEITGPYYIFKDGGCDITVCSISGGDVPIDAGSVSEQFKTENDKKMEADGSGPLKATKALKDLDVTTFSIVWFAGGHGTCVDFPTDAVGSAVSKALAAGKVVGLVCHGLLALVNAKAADGAPLVKGRKITCFSDAEEVQVGLQEKVPFLVEKRLKELGAEVEVGDPWSDKSVQDDKLVTGQNPQSSVSAAKLALAATS